MGEGTLALCRTTQASLDELGRDSDTRRFLLALLLTTRYHLTSRPVSFANDSFFHSLARSSDKVLECLHGPDWQLLDLKEEEGIALLRPISERPVGLETREELSEEFRVEFRRYFRGLNLPWSTLPAVSNLTLDDWPRPGRLLFAVGPNIGIGDEMIFFQAARLLSRRFPDARLEVSSYHETLWDRCDFVDEVRYLSDNQIEPFARAKEVMAADPTALVVFVEFASAHIYRHLEVIRSLERFIYLDTGARLARLIDQGRPGIVEYTSLIRHSIYALLADLLRAVGVDAAESRFQEISPGPLQAPSRRAVAKIFVNPFSSKDVKRIRPAWWSKVLNLLGRQRPIEAEIFCGINPQTRAYAREIQAGLEPDSCPSALLGESDTPSILQTLESAMKCQAVLGLDTFTGHLGNLRRIPSVTVFFSSFWEVWRVPDPSSFNVSIHTDPAMVAQLLERLVWKPESREFLELSAQLRERAATLPTIVSENAPAVEIGRCMSECRDLSERLARIDPDLALTFSDTPPSYFDALERSLKRCDPSKAPDPAHQRIVRKAWRHWADCNYSRYLRYLERYSSA